MVETQEEGQRKNNTEKNCLYVRWGRSEEEEVVEKQEEGQRKKNTEKDCLYIRWGRCTCGQSQEQIEISGV